jgi:hypothetical protein
MKTTLVGFLLVMLMISSVVANDCPPFDKEPYSHGYYLTAFLISDGVLSPYYISDRVLSPYWASLYAVKSLCIDRNFVEDSVECMTERKGSYDAQSNWAKATKCWSLWQNLSEVK